MNVSSAKENILKKIRKALSISTPLPFPHSEGHTSVFLPSVQEPELEFAEQFSKLQGKFIFCIDHRELVQKLNEVVKHNEWTKIYCREDKLKQNLRGNIFNDVYSDDLAGSDVAITSCELLVARTGTIVMSAAQQSGRTVSVYSPIHICIAYTNQLVYDIRDGLEMLKEKYATGLPSMITFASGPSRTADIEKTLVVGVHGPKEVYVFLIDQK
jgi:L-lactate dehydrogenase complex protein LldG